MEASVDFCTVAQEHGIQVLYFKLPKCGSASAEVDGQCYIGMDNSRPMTYGEEQARLGHELGHCLYGGFYTRTTPYEIAERYEVRADRWYILNAIPRERLFELLRKGYDAWEIAEMLDTTEDYVRRAYYYYQDCEMEES